MRTETGGRIKMNRRVPSPFRPHTNNDGYRQVKEGKTRTQIRKIAKRLRIPYKKDDTEFEKLWKSVNSKNNLFIGKIRRF